MLIFETWKRVLIWAVVLTGVLLAMPNLFYDRVERHNDALIEGERGASSDALAEDLAGWPGFLPSGLVNLGLDLRGGAHLLAEVRIEQTYAARMKAFWPEVRNALRAERAVVG
ncbi:MAG: protein translocase subunit SecD, partial [Paracoccaceae bacterium]